jgi:hypothetical protein
MTMPIKWGTDIGRHTKVEECPPLFDAEPFEVPSVDDGKIVPVRTYARRAPRRPRVDAPKVSGTFRSDDHATSVAAGLKNVGRRGGQRRRIAFAFLWAWPRGLTDEQACELAGCPLKSSPWKRCSELREWGYLEDTGDTRPTSTGSAAKIWKVSEAGRAALLLEVPEPRRDE